MAKSSIESTSASEKTPPETPNKSNLSGTQKAAIFLVAMGPEISAAVFKHLEERELENITFEITRMNNVDSKQKEAVLREFHDLVTAQSFIEQGGMDFAKAALEKAMGKRQAAAILERLQSASKPKPFQKLRTLEAEDIYQLIQHEHPQTIAVILAYLEHNKAARVLGLIPREQQTDITKRIAKIDKANPDVIRAVEQTIEKNMSELSSETNIKAGGTNVLAEILNQVDRSTERRILEYMEDDDPELADAIKQKMFLFEDIAKLDTRSIQRVVSAVETTDLVKALKAVDESIRDEFYASMSKRKADLLREELEFMGAIRLREAQDAQQKIIAIVRKLEEQGQIVIPKDGEQLI